MIAALKDSRLVDNRVIDIGITLTPSSLLKIGHRQGLFRCVTNVSEKDG